MNGRNNGDQSQILRAMQSQEIERMKQDQQVSFLRANHMEIMRTVYLKLVNEQITASGQWTGTVPSEALDSYAHEAKRVADRFMIANSFMTPVDGAQ